MVDSNATTIVGESILISGNLSGDEDLTVLGRVRGSINLSRTLVIEESGVVKADMEVRNAVVSGVVVGNITASDSVEILEQGRVVGDIKAPRVIIVDGARFRGTVDMGNLEAPRASGPLPSRTVERTALTPRQSQPTTSVPQRRPTPPPPKPQASSSSSSSSTTSSSSSSSKSSGGKRSGKKAPMPGKKKIKKKVVVKKRRR